MWASRRSTRPLAALAVPAAGVITGPLLLLPWRSRAPWQLGALRPVHCGEKASQSCDAKSPSGGSHQKLSLPGPLSLAGLWAPFWYDLAYPVAGVGFALAHLDWFLSGWLPTYVRHVASFGALLCLVDSVASFRRAMHRPCKEVKIEEGSESLSSSSRQVEIKWACAAMRGWRPEMEDSHVSMVLRNDTGNRCLFAVFDGHGGWQVSSVVKALLPRMLAEKLQHLELQAKDSIDIGQVLTETVESVDDALLAGPLGVGKLYDHYQHPFSRVGCTSCIAVLDVERDELVVANTGDSRAVLCRAGKAVALSLDHKPEDAEEFARIYRAGGFVIRMGPCFRVEGGLNLSRALGDFVYKANTRLPSTEQKVVATPSIMRDTWQPESEDEFLVVACDGIFERLSRQDVVDIVRAGLHEGQAPQEVLHMLLLEACARTSSPMEPGQDNETAILVQWHTEPCGP